ncbi:MAG TPA: aquaporin [Polyangiaceae bacterium]|nr:aquaporin [Polyangiaceae bacterium]
MVAPQPDGPSTACAWPCRARTQAEILTLAPISGEHFKPALTLANASLGGLPWREVPGYLVAQVG